MHDKDFLKDLYSITNRKNIGYFLKKYNLNKIMCEVGVYAGKNLLQLLNSANSTILYGIDCWSCTNNEDRKQELNKKFNHLKEIEDSNPHIKIIKDFSPQVSKKFPNNFFDFIYIDADHTYEAIKNDVYAWWPKVKMNGIISGHDYKNLNRCRVKLLIDEFVDKNNIEYLHVVSKRPRSWMIIKDKEEII